MSSGSRQLAQRLLGNVGVTIDGTEPWSLKVHDERLWDRVIAQRQLGFGEAYMDGWWNCDQMDEMLTRIIAGDVLQEITPSLRVVAQVVRSNLVNFQTKGRAAANARHHYDIGNDLYERMLDPRMVYSCAYWQNASTLDEAQVAKLDLICRKLQLEPGMTVRFTLIPASRHCSAMTSAGFFT